MMGGASPPEYANDGLRPTNKDPELEAVRAGKQAACWPTRIRYSRGTGQGAKGSKLPNARSRVAQMSDGHPIKTALPSLDAQQVHNPHLERDPRPI